MSPQGVDHRRDGSREAEVLCRGRTVLEIHGRRTGRANDRSGMWLEHDGSGPSEGSSPNFWRNGGRPSYGPKGTPDAIRLEEVWNQLATEQPLSLLCAYPMSKFSGEKDKGSLIAISQLQTIRMCIR
jgi:hypothetical protein